jgi:hypothetical protein
MAKSLPFSGKEGVELPTKGRSIRLLNVPCLVLYAKGNRKTWSISES